MAHRFAQRQLRLGALSLLVGAALLLAYVVARRTSHSATGTLDIDDVFLGLLAALNTFTAFGLIRAAQMVGRIETQRGAAEKEVQRRTAWLESVVQAMPIGVGVVENVGDHLILSNPIYRELLQESVGDASKDHAHRNFRLFDRRGRPLPRRDWPSSRALIDGQTSRDVELQIELAGGRRLWMAVSAAPIRGDPDGAPAAVVAFSNITARKHAEAEREALMRRLVEVQEEERLHFARELHDELGQELTAVLIGLKALETASSETGKTAHLTELRDIVGRMNEQVHHMAGDLRPLILEDLGLLPAVEELALGWGSKLGIEADLLLDGLEGPMPPSTAIVLYRVLQEALTNVARHSGARRFSITARRAGDVLRVAVEDDGKGFDPGENGFGRTRRNGLVGMRERLATLGGDFTIESWPGHGTTVYVCVPLASGRGTNDTETEVSSLHRG